MTIDETKDLLTAIAGMYPNVSVSKDTIRGYHLLLADLPYEPVIAALPRILADHRTFMPTAPELRAALMGTPSIQSGVPVGAEAWEVVQREVRDRGFMRGGRFDDETIQRAVNAVGWEQICMCELDNLNTLRSQFLKLYESFREAKVKEVTGANALRLMPPAAKKIAG